MPLERFSRWTLESHEMMQYPDNMRSKTGRETPHTDHAEENRDRLDRLRSAIGEIERRGVRISTAREAQREDEKRRELTGDCTAPGREAETSNRWPSLDAIMASAFPRGDLATGGVHEWLGPTSDAESDAGPNRRPWHPPLDLLLRLVDRVLRDADQPGDVVWIGRACWPHPVALAQRDRGLLDRSLFVDASSVAERVWAMDLALRSGAAPVVIADGRGVQLPDSRRLQLAAGSGGATGLIARPARDRAMLSAARTRWLVRPAPAAGESPRWDIELLRCKSAPAAVGARSFVDESQETDAQLKTSERSYETGDVDLAGRAAHRPVEPPAIPGRVAERRPRA